MSCNNNLTKITIWYQPTSSWCQIKVPPKDWIGYQMIKDDLGIELKLKALPSSIVESDKIILGAANTGSLPDIFPVGKQTIKDLILSDSIIPVDEYLSLMPVRTESLRYNNYLQETSYNNKAYGLTSVKSIPRSEGLVIRKDWLDNLGLDVPKTLDEFLSVMYAFTYNDPDGNGIKDTYGYGAFLDYTDYEDFLGKMFSPIFGAFGCEGTFNVDKNMLSVHDPNFYYALNTVRHLNALKVIDPNWVIYRSSSFKQAWKHGRFGCMREQYAELFKMSNYIEFDNIFPNGEWIVIDPIKAYNIEFETNIGIDVQEYTSFCISKKCYDNNNVEKVCELLEWMSTKGYNVIHYGEEGKNYSICNGEISYNNVPIPYTSIEFAPYRQLVDLIASYSQKELKLDHVSYATKSGKIINPADALVCMQNKNWGRSIKQMPTPRTTFIDGVRYSLLELAIGLKDLNEQSWENWINDFDEMGGIEWEMAIRKVANSQNLQE